jgi:hypothetical protein
LWLALQWLALQWLALQWLALQWLALQWLALQWLALQWLALQWLAFFYALAKNNFFEGDFEMRVFGQCLVFGLLIFCMSAISYSEEILMDKYNVKFRSSADGPDYELYKMLNNYLGLTGSNAYSSNVDLFNERVIDPSTQWITSGSSLLHAFSMGRLLHRVNVLTEEGAELCRLYDGGENYVPGEVYPLADGLNLDFQLLSYTSPTDDSFPYEEYMLYSDQEKNDDGEIHMLAFDITDLYNSKTGGNFASVHMFGWEDRLSSDISDYDYNEMVVIMANLTPTVSATPEPASMLIVLLGGGIALAIKRRRKKIAAE